MSTDPACAQIRPLVDAYIDGEVDVLRAVDIERHLQTCPDCSAILRNRQTLRAAFADQSLYFRAPEGLQKRLDQQLHQADRPPVRLTVRSIRLPQWAWLVTGLLAASLVFGLIWTASRAGSDQTLAGEVLAAHLRSLMAAHLEDIVSTDQHTVKPWFDGKLDFSPLVVDLSAQGFPLIGGRLDYLDGRPVAALVYQRHKHIINLFIWPTNDPTRSDVVQTTDNGYDLLHWTDGGMNFWAASDVNEIDLQTFVGLIRDAAASASLPEIGTASPPAVASAAP